MHVCRQQTGARNGLHQGARTGLDLDVVRRAAIDEQPTGTRKIAASQLHGADRLESAPRGIADELELAHQKSGDGLGVVGHQHPAAQQVDQSRCDLLKGRRPQQLSRADAVVRHVTRIASGVDDRLPSRSSVTTLVEVHHGDLDDPIPLVREQSSGFQTNNGVSTFGHGHTPQCLWCEVICKSDTMRIPAWGLVGIAKYCLNAYLSAAVFLAEFFGGSRVSASSSDMPFVSGTLRSTNQNDSPANRA